MTKKDVHLDSITIVSRNKSYFNTSPKLVPAGEERDTGHWREWLGAGTKVDAPILGNGDMLAAFSGEPHCPQFWVTTNDFWQMESSYNHQAPYLGMLASGHFQQADTHDAPYLALLDLSKEMSRRLLGHDGDESRRYFCKLINHTKTL